MLFTALAEGPTPMENLGTVVSQVWSWITSGLNTITGSPILLIGLGIFTAGAVIVGKGCRHAHGVQCGVGRQTPHRGGGLYPYGHHSGACLFARGAL